MVIKFNCCCIILSIILAGFVVLVSICLFFGDYSLSLTTVKKLPSFDQEDDFKFL